jgi:hypothetical protein
MSDWTLELPPAWGGELGSFSRDMALRAAESGSIAGNQLRNGDVKDMSTQFYERQDAGPIGGRNGVPRRNVGVGVDARKLWAGGAASAVVAGLVALVGVLVSRWLFKVPVLAPRQDGAYGDVRTTALILATMAAALVATGLVHLLMLGTLRPLLFFGWIVALVTTITVIFPFSTTAALDAKIATAVVSLAIGVATGTLVGGVAARSVPRGRLT